MVVVDSVIHFRCNIFVFIVVAVRGAIIFAFGEIAIPTLHMSRHPWPFAQVEEVVDHI